MVLPFFYPDRRFRRCWDFSIFVGVFWYSLVVPIQLAMPNVQLAEWAVRLDQFFSVLFIADIFIILRTAVYVAGEPVSSQKFVLEKYAKGWLLFDLLSAIPFATLATLAGFAGLAPLLGLFRLLRIPKIPELLKEAGSFLPMGAGARMVITLFWLVFIINIVSCIWAAIYPNNGTQDNVTFFMKSIYWSVMTLSTTGYGDIVATDNVGWITASLTMLIGVIFNGFIIGSISSILLQSNAYRLKQQEKLANLAAFFNQFGVPKSLQNSIFSYYAHSATERTETGKEIIDSLPDAFQKPVLDRVNMHIIKQVPLFKGTSPECLMSFVDTLIPQIFSPGEDIIEFGDIGQEMFFLQHGIVEVLTEDGHPVTRLRNNSFFGEMALLGGIKRTATIRAITICDIYKLQKSDFDRIMEQYPDVKARLTSLSNQRKPPPAASSE